MRFSSREVVLAVVAFAAALFGVTALLARPRLDEWKELRARQRAVVQEIGADRSLLQESEKWAALLAEKSELLPQHPPDKEVDVYWLSVMDLLALKNGLSITKRQVGEEKKHGDIYELPIECKEWGGRLDALVHFLFELQSEGAMLDVRQLQIRPTDKGLLRGRFTLYCAYTRGAEAEEGAGE